MTPQRTARSTRERQQARHIDNRIRQTSRAQTILGHAKQSVSHLDEIYGIVSERRRGRRRVGGSRPDQQQDLLRAMLLFAAAAVDAVVKQLVEDCLQEVIQRDEGAFRQFVSHIETHLRSFTRSEVDNKSPEKQAIASIAMAIASDTPQKVLIHSMKKSLTGSSLQSVDQLLSVASKFAIPKDAFIDDVDELKGAFKKRNQIAHEMDIIFSQRRRVQRTCSRPDMKHKADLLLNAASRFLGAVENKMEQPNFQLLAALERESREIGVST